MTPEAGAVTAALLGAVAYGTGDFLGGRASLRLSTPMAVAIAQTVAVAAMVGAHAGAPIPGPEVVAAGTVAGLAYAIGIGLLYHGFAHGRIGVVAPLCGLFSILVPLAGDLWLGRSLGGWTHLGIALCALAVVYIAGSALTGESHRIDGRSAFLGIASGTGYGISDLVLGVRADADGDGTMLVTRIVAAALGFALLALALRRNRLGGPGGTAAGRLVKTGLAAGGIAAAAAAGGFDLLGQIGYVTAASRGSMGVAAALVALFPAVSVLLAVIFLRETVSRRQLVGFAVSAAGVVMVSI
jgi:drug/metabolite transporter (DMT)-like permease